MKSSIEAIVFDFGNVIVNIDVDRTYRAFSELTFKSAEKIKNLFHQNQVFRNFEIGKFNDEEFRDVIRQVLGYPLNDNEIDAAWNALILDIPKNRYEFLTDLRIKHNIYLLSNTNNIHLEHCKKMWKKNFGDIDFTNFFKKSFLSFEMEKYKPDYNIYQEVIETLNVKPEKILFFDDNANNIQAALDMRIKAVKIDPPECFTNILPHLI